MTKEEAIAAAAPFVIEGGYSRAYVMHGWTMDDYMRHLISKHDCGDALFAYGAAIDENGDVHGIDEAENAIIDARDWQALDGDLHQVLTHESDPDSFMWENGELSAAVRKNGGFNYVTVFVHENEL